MNEFMNEIIESLRPTETIELSVDEFLKEYKSKWIGYCEIIILDNGNIVLAQPSHTIRFEILLGIGREEINERMPISASPIHWLIAETGFASVWYDFQITPKEMTQKQKETLALLSKNKMIMENIVPVRDIDFKDTRELFFQGSLEQGD